MKNIVKSISAIWNYIRSDKQNMLLFALAVGSVVIAIVYLFLSDRIEDNYSQDYYENPFVENQENYIDWNKVRVNPPNINIDSLELSSYKASLFSQQDVEAFFMLLGLSNLQLETYGEDIFVWTKDNDIMINFSITTGNLSLNSQEGIRLVDIERGFVDETSINEYFEDFLKVYFKLKTKFKYDVSEEGPYFKVKGNWLLDDYAVVTPGNKENSFSAVFNSGGDLIAIDIVPVEFTTQNEKAPIMEVSAIKEYLSLAAYPKEEYLNILPGQDSDCGNMAHCYYDYGPDDITSIVIDDVEIVYYFNPVSPESVLPVYKFTGKGNVLDKNDNRAREIIVTVYANAMDPSRLITRGDNQSY